MSNAYPIIWAMKHAPVADVEERMILVAMADAADADGCNSYRSMRSLQNIATGVSKATIQRRQRAMAKRGLIRPDSTPPPARYLKIPKNRRPPRWEVCIPYSWWSDDQRREIQHEREDRGLPPLTPQDRPDLAPAPPKKARADKGKPNPNRRRKEVRQAETGQQPDESTAGEVSQTPQSENGGESWGVSETPPEVSSRDPQGCLEDTQPSFGDPPRVPSPDSPPRSVRSAHVGDADARANDAASGAEEKISSDEERQQPPQQPPAGRRAPQSPGGGGSAGRGSRKPSPAPTASPEARQILGGMPRGFREGAPAWVLARLAERIDRMLGEGWSPGAILAAAREVAPPTEGDHVAAIRRVRQALPALAGEGRLARLCPGCGAELFESGRCGACDDDGASMSADELAELEAARRALTEDRPTPPEIEAAGVAEAAAQDALAQGDHDAVRQHVRAGLSALGPVFTP